MKLVSALTWLPLARSADSVATVQVNFSTDTQWTVFTGGTIDDGKNIDAPYVLVDNLADPASATITIGGGLILAIPAFTRKLFHLPEPAQQVVLTGSSGSTLTLYFCTNPAYLVEDANLLAIQQAAQGKVKFPYNIYNAFNQPQSFADQAATVELVPTVAQMNYNLMGIAANGVPSGWITFIQNNGAAQALIVPSGGDTINGLITNAITLEIFPGESGYLTSDGAQWFFQWATRRKPSFTYALASLTQNPNHENKKFAFSGAVAQTYSLLAASSFGNGFVVDIENRNTNGQAVTLAPNGTDTINGINANFTILGPGSRIRLFIDDTLMWRIEGHIVTPPQALPAVSNQATLAHHIGFRPAHAAVYLQNVTAELNYAVGDRTVTTVATGAAADQGMNARVDATNLYATTSTQGILVVNPTTGAQAAITIANWNFGWVIDV